MDFDPASLQTEYEDPAAVHDNDRATRQLFSMLVLQAIYDLSSRDAWIRWDAIQYFHGDVFPDHCWGAGLDPQIVLQRLIRDGKVPDHIPPHPKSRR